jgi:tetratricopeptide (TPR) repeat protein
MRAQRGEVDDVAPPLLNCVENRHPETPLILETLALGYLPTLRYGPALFYLNRWVEEVPQSAPAHYWRGWVLERLKDSRGALADYQRALELDPDYPPAHLRLAEVWLEKSSPPEVRPHLEWLRKHYPERPDVLARLGQYHFLQGHPRKARRLLEAAVKKLPDDPLLLIYLARLDIQEGQPARAEHLVRRVLERDATDTEAQYTLIASLRRQGREKEAAAVLAQYEKDTAQLKRAIHVLQQEAEHPTSDPGPLSEVGAVFLRAGQEGVGLYWLQQALKRDPDHQPTHKVLAEYYERKGAGAIAAAHRRRLSAGHSP